MRYEDLLELLQMRRTVRGLRPDALEEGVLEKILEAARWAPTGFNMQPQELLVLRDPPLKAEVKKVLDGFIESNAVLEIARESWQGPPWKPDSRFRVSCPAAPVYILVLGDTRRRAGLPMNVRFEVHKGDSIFEASLANALFCAWLAATSLGLGVQPVSAVKNGAAQCLVKHLLNIPDFMYLYEMLAIGYPAEGAEPKKKLMRHLDEMVHYDRVPDDGFMTEEEVRKQIRTLRLGNVARHAPAEEASH